ncbi:metal ABC transporter solute-binding protein, Zn/Mn family [uncultured Corynebacterium sp.]|uniref:metal ABC transporter solute-binding protein, Zn/Mn family n=1 Tax=uncultured Corynebacterium sp. TaxID=159447 RepID=UPI002597CD63|nr:zinc ABC transporter substrate-binding protein [uncultured Corynebacterium sp.]
MPRFTSLRAAAGALTATVTALGLAACSPGATDSSTASSTAPAEGAPETVATTQVWADVASSVLNREVEAVISNASTDPHDYEPTAADHAKINSADLVVANGGAYDAALYSTADHSKIVSALPLAEGAEHGHEHDHAHEGEGEHAHGHAHEGNEHVWYSPATVSEVGRKIAESAGGDSNTDALDASMSQISESLTKLPTARVAQVHPIAEAPIEESPLELVTPDAYRDATLSETEPSTAAVAEFIDALRAGEIDLLISNPQSPNASAQRIIDEAKANNIPVVEIYETPPNGENFLDYFARVVGEIGQALQ